MRSLLFAVSVVLAGCHWILPLGVVEGRDGPSTDRQATDHASDRTLGDGSDHPDGGNPAPRPPYRVTANGWSVRLPLFRDATRDYGIRAIWGNGDDDIWAVGGGGWVIHNFGQGWRRVDSGTTLDLNGVWGSSGQVWIVGGGGTLLHFDGKKLAQAKLENVTGDLHSVHGASTSRVWVGGDSGLTLRRTAAGAWDQLQSGSYIDAHDIHVGSTGEVRVTDAGKLRRYEDGKWTDEPMPAQKSINSIAGMAGATRPQFASTTGGEVLGLDLAGTWKIWSYNVPVNSLFVDPDGTLWGAATGGVYQLEETHATLLAAAGAETFRDIWGGGGEHFAVAEAARMAYHDGKSWHQVSLAAEHHASGVAGVDGETWIVGTSGVGRDTGRGFIKIPWAGSGTLRAVWVGKPGEVWAVGNDGLALHYDTAAHKMEEVSTQTTTNLVAVWGVSGGAVWACGKGVLVHESGGWTQSTDGSWTDIWVSGNGEVWVVGWGGEVRRRSNNTWSKVTVPISGDLFGVHGTSPADVWIVGEKGQAAHFDGTSWTAHTLPNATGTLRAVWVGSGAVWVAGDAGVFRKSGGQWTKQQIGTTQAMLSIWANSDTDVWAAGEQGHVVHFDDRL